MPPGGWADGAAADGADGADGAAHVLRAKLIRFGRFASRDSQRLDENAPAPFDFLGFTHFCGRSRAGKFKLKRKTSGKKLRIKLSEIRLWFHHQLSAPVGEMWRTLNAKLCGHDQYYGINDNWPMLMAFRGKVRRMAKRQLAAAVKGAM